MAFPSSVKFANATLTSNTPTLRTKSISGVETRTSVGTQYFQIQGSFVNLEQADLRLLSAFLVDGSVNSFELPLPQELGNVGGTDYGTLNINANATAGSTSVTIQSPDFSTGTIIKAGQLVRFSSTHDKVYMVTSDLVLSSNTGTLNIFPALTTAVTTADDLNYRSIKMKVRLANDNMAAAISTAQLSTFDILFEEVIE